MDPSRLEFSMPREEPQCVQCPGRTPVGKVQTILILWDVSYQQAILKFLDDIHGAVLKLFTWMGY